MLKRHCFGRSRMLPLRHALGFAVLLAVSFLVSWPLAAQQRPLRTVNADIVPRGTLRAQVGFDFLQDVDFPLSGLSGDLTSVAVINLRLGVGRIVEVQVEGTAHHFLDVRQQQTNPPVTPVLTGPGSTHGVGDFSLFTKIRIVGETTSRPAVAFRFGFQMPNSDQSRGIGTNTTDVFASLIGQKSLGKLALITNIGVGILQAPLKSFSQNDVITYAGAFVYQAHRRVNIVGEVAGRHSTRDITADLVGTESRAQGRFGLQIQAGGFQWDVAGIAGVYRHDPTSGFTFGVSRDIRLFGRNNK